MNLTQPIAYASWCAKAPKTDRMVAAFGTIGRDKPRSCTEAEFLRRVGTPTRLIGPVRAFG